MLRILSSRRRMCSGLTRRDLLRVGGLGLAGLGLPELLRLQARAAETQAEARPRSFGAAKAVILCHLYGAPSQLETFDPKPEAPVEIRGELGAIPTSLPGALVGELLPQAAKVLDRCTVLRSLSHPYPIHGVAYALTGVPTIDVAMELSPRDPRHWPFFGSAVDYVDAARRPPAGPMVVPGNLALPFPMSSRRVGEVPRAGPYAAFLGGQFDPVWTQFVGRGTRGIRKTLQAQVFDEPDPYMGTSPEGHFVIPSVTGLPDEPALDRLARRRSLLEQLEAARRELDQSLAGLELDRYQTMAYDLLQSSRLAEALDVRREPAAIRELYGHTLFGQACLAARRLVEAGGRVITVFWDEYGLAGSGWDTHWNHYQRMRQELCPGFDQAWYGLITDLDQRGLLDETLVVCTSEHGRTPRLDNSPGGGRDHWSRVYSSVLAGGGTARGRVVGASDRRAAEVADRPISPKDLLATMYHLLGIDHRTILHDRLGRPLPLVEGEVLADTLA